MKAKNFIISKFKKGFTLAEVLITLVIVGVIAALTIPTVINNTQKQECVAGLKKAYSLLSTATNAIIAEEGKPNCNYGGWNCSMTKVANLYKKHLSVAKDCGIGRNYDCFEQGRPKTYSGGYSNDNWSYWATEPYKIILNNGMQVVFGDADHDCVYGDWNNTGIINLCRLVIVDVNGAKAPNTFGKDVYLFAIKEDGFFPAGIDNDSRCPSYAGGMGCANRVLRENAINY